MTAGTSLPNPSGFVLEGEEGSLTHPTCTKFPYSLVDGLRKTSAESYLRVKIILATELPARCLVVWIESGVGTKVCPQRTVGGAMVPQRAQAPLGAAVFWQGQADRSLLRRVYDVLWFGLPSTRATPKLDVNMCGGWDIRIVAYAIMKCTQVAPVSSVVGPNVRIS